MDERLKCIGDYWTQRSSGFSDYMNEHMEEELGKPYYRILKEVSTGCALKVLDIGCGPGVASMFLAELNNDVTAIDWSEGMIECASKNSVDKGFEINFLKMNAQELEFGDESFDLVISSRLVWNLPDPLRAYSEWLRVLKRGGTIVLYDGNYFLRKDSEEDSEPEDESPNMYQGADFNIIRNLAKILPLSKEARPAWDVDALVRLGADKLYLEVESWRPVDENGLSIPSTFVIKASKPLGERTND